MMPHYSISQLDQKYQISDYTLRQWLQRYKTAGVVGLKTYKTYEELVADIDAYMSFYNNHRYQEKHNSLAPLEMRNRAIA